MSSYPSLKYFLFSLEALDILLTDRGLPVIHSASPCQQRLTVSILADWVCQRAVRNCLSISKTNTLARCSLLFSFSTIILLPMVWYINSNAKPISDIPSFDVERAPSSSRPLSCNFVHRYHRSSSSNVYTLISRRSSMTPLVVPQCPKADSWIRQLIANQLR